jgi:hypothetical protein
MPTAKRVARAAARPDLDNSIVDISIVDKSIIVSHLRGLDRLSKSAAPLLAKVKVT